MRLIQRPLSGQTNEYPVSYQAEHRFQGRYKALLAGEPSSVSRRS